MHVQRHPSQGSLIVGVKVKLKQNCILYSCRARSLFVSICATVGCLLQTHLTQQSSFPYRKPIGVGAPTIVWDRLSSDSKPQQLKFRPLKVSFLRSIRNKFDIWNLIYIVQLEESRMAYISIEVLHGHWLGSHVSFHLEPTLLNAGSFRRAGTDS